jgi:hypothetical protein
MSDAFPLPPPPDPVKAEQWAGQIRLLIAILAGAGFVGAGWAAVSVEQITNILTSFLTIASLVGTAWASYRSWQQKREQRAKEVASAAASAVLGEPVTVAVTPPGQPNLVSKVSSTEIAQAPFAPLDVAPSPAPAVP